MNRRNFGTALAASLCAVALAGCGVVTRKTVNGITTITINMAKLDAYAQAIDNAVKTLLGNPLIASVMGPGVAAGIEAAAMGVASAAALLDKQANGSATLTFNATNPPAALKSLQADAVKVFNGLKDAVTAAGAAVPAKVSQAFSALETIVAFVLALMPSVAAAKAKTVPVVKMPEAKALKVLGAG